MIHDFTFLALLTLEPLILCFQLHKMQFLGLLICFLILNIDRRLPNIEAQGFSQHAYYFILLVLDWFQTAGSAGDSCGMEVLIGWPLWTRSEGGLLGLIYSYAVTTNSADITQTAVKHPALLALPIRAVWHGSVSYQLFRNTINMLQNAFDWTRE